MLRRRARCSYPSSRKWLPPTCAPWLHQLPDCGTLDEMAAGDEWESPMSTETSVPRQRDPAEAALAELLMPQAPFGVALFGNDLRFTAVNAALIEAVPPHPLLPRPDDISAAFAGKLPSEVWPGV